MKNYSIPRKEAWEIAWVSLRTLDRYVLSKKIDYKKVKWRVLFCEDDLKRIKIEKNINQINEVKTDFDFKKDKTEHKIFQKNPIESNSENLNSYKNLPEQFQENFWDMIKIVQLSAERDSFKKMFEIANAELKEKQNQLERVNFKLWEVLAKQNIPLLENKQKSEEIKNLQKKLKESENIVKSLKDEISFQKFIKTVFVIILLLTVSILSFWYVYNFKI